MSRYFDRIFFTGRRPNQDKTPLKVLLSLRLHDPEAAVDVAAEDQVVLGVDEDAPDEGRGAVGVGGWGELAELPGDALVVHRPPDDAVGVPGGEELAAVGDLGVVVGEGAVGPGRAAVRGREGAEEGRVRLVAVVVHLDLAPGAELGLIGAVTGGEVLGVD